MTMGALAVKDQVARTFEAARLNEIANHPEVRPTCGGDGESPLDFTAFLADPKNHAILWDHGAFMFLWTAPDTYEVHIMVLPEGRGRAAYHMAAEGIDYITSVGAEKLWARIECNSEGLRHFTAQAGFERCLSGDLLDIGFGPVAYDLYQLKLPSKGDAPFLPR